MESEVAKTIELLTNFKRSIDRWFNGEYAPEGDAALRSSINRMTRAAQDAVRRVGCLKLVSAAPPPAVGGPILKNADPFDFIFESYFGRSMIPMLSDMVEQAIGVYGDPSYKPASEPDTSGSVRSLDIFISHSSADASLAEQLIHLLRNSLQLSSEVIRCTSVDGYRLPAGADTDDHLRREVLEAPVFIALISEESIRSAYVLFELGARWGARRQLIPLLAPDAGPEVLRGPIASLNALQCDSRAQLQQLVRDCAATLGVEPDTPDSYDSFIARILEGVSTVALEQPGPDDPHGSLQNAERIIMEHCESEWPNDYRMREHCEDQQRQALAQLRSGVPNDIPPEIFNQIRDRAQLEWPTDFRMRLYAERQQLQAYRDLQRRRR